MTSPPGGFSTLPEFVLFYRDATKSRERRATEINTCVEMISSW